MSLTGILTVIWYTVQPLLWLIVLALVVLLVAQLAGWLKGYRISNARQGLSWLLAAVTGVAALLLAPTITGSQLSMVVTVFDWVALIGLSIGVAVYSWLVINPLIYLTENRALPHSQRQRAHP
ncbi:MAG: hypothetical protein LAT65_16965 [Saccharospirillum sp.]|nr:hypothetical protein [Saccharospirillum sp.]